MSINLKEMVRERIKKTSLYWKTWVITAVTILITIGLFFLIFSLFATRFLENNQQKKFDQTSQLIFRSVETEGINQKVLDNYMIAGYNVFISYNEQLIYPEYAEISFNSAIQSSELDEGQEAAEIGDTVMIEPQIDGNIDQIETVGLFQTIPLMNQQTIAYQGIPYLVEIMYPATVNQEEIKGVFYSIIPYFIVIGLLVSSVISVIYARYFSRKITRLNRTVHSMSTSSEPMTYEAMPGDELQDLENSVHHMYQELQFTLQKLNQEMSTVKRLEEDRQVFMRGATHELKTPIMAMTTMLEGMMAQVEGYEDHDHYLQACYTRLQSMSRLVNEMLEVSRIESVMFSGQMELKKATEEVIEIYSYMLEDKEIQLETRHLTSGLVHIPKRNLQKVLSNLVGNAVKYTPTQGKLVIVSNDQEWQIRNQVKNVQQLKEANIFAPFVSFETECNSEFEKSHGLGLYIVDTILTQYGYHYSWEVNEVTGEFIFRIKLN
ncbi:HAMP domain-containing histidine kinase [Vagococcus sp. BWB3-3]|uniref:histidine kinase n=1 Tax=Vagococcus allomyrinae TaxID=2794353 RepID=A0A940PFM5_9ENTE|nr:HAMP domain-containing sensor histidine kinase [Vagococcus allomyrinae]MBP1043083.1 HAMP domain-containing histidine kinase [Vagococcus allomyrinae]